MAVVAALIAGSIGQDSGSAQSIERA